MGFKEPTPKQVRYHYKKMIQLRYRLQRALNDAHEAGVLRYLDYAAESPCKTLYETQERIRKGCESQLAEAMRKEIGYN